MRRPLEETTTAEALLGFNEQDGFTVEGDVTPDGGKVDVGVRPDDSRHLYAARPRGASDGG